MRYTWSRLAHGETRRRIHLEDTFPTQEAAIKYRDEVMFAGVYNAEAYSKLTKLKLIKVPENWVYNIRPHRWERPRR